MNIAEKCVVSIHYTLTNDQGEELDSSSGGEPFKYLHGAGNIVPGLERALDGKTSGDTLDVALEPKDAYGDVNPDLVQQVPRSAFDTKTDIEPGMQFQAQNQQGEVRLITVTEVGEGVVTVDGNHPLAGQVLHFAVSIEAVRAATDVEIERGHAH